MLILELKFAVSNFKFYRQQLYNTLQTERALNSPQPSTKGEIKIKNKKTLPSTYPTHYSPNIPNQVETADQVVMNYLVSGSYLYNATKMEMPISTLWKQFLREEDRTYLSDLKQKEKKSIINILGFP